MKKFISSLCCIAILIGLFCLVPNFTNSADAENENKEIVGTWLNAYGVDDRRYALQFTEDGIIREYTTRYLGGVDNVLDTMNYTYKDNKLTVDGNEYECYLVENGLIIKDLVKEGYFLFTRA